MSDQPSLCKANRDVNHIIYRLDDEYNLITYTQDRRYRNAKILHISFFKNASYLQSKKVLMFVKNNGIHNSWLKKSILHPECTFFPFNNEIYSSTCRDRWRWTYQIAEYAVGYGQFIDPNFEVLKVPSCLNSLIHWCFVKQWFKLGAWIWLNWCYCHLYLKHFKPYANLFQNTYESVDV